MNDVTKYNVCKGVSTALTVGTPVITLACCGEFFVHRSDTAMSTAGIFVLLILALIFKDKLAEKWKTPSAFIVCTAIFLLIELVENIILPVKYVCIATMISTGVDELTFKHMYKRIEILMPKQAETLKRIGFIMAKQTTVDELKKKGDEK